VSSVDVVSGSGPGSSAREELGSALAGSGSGVSAGGSEGSGDSGGSTASDGWLSVRAGSAWGLGAATRALATTDGSALTDASGSAATDGSALTDGSGSTASGPLTAPCEVTFSDPASVATAFRRLGPFRRGLFAFLGSVCSSRGCSSRSVALTGTTASAHGPIVSTRERARRRPWSRPILSILLAAMT